ncbi:Uncharacterised protein [Mycobacteroides abscessus subsp. abscessus]|nr:Uncharacterised protein [Mycobacteroides abscessus subsp. abscessus]
MTVGAVDLLRRFAENPCADLEVVGEVFRALAGVDLLGDRRPPRRIGIAPRLDPEGPVADGVGNDGCVEDIRFARGRHADVERGAIGRFDVQGDPEGVVPLPPRRRADRDQFSDNTFGRVLPCGDQWLDVVDAHPADHFGPLSSAATRRAGSPHRSQGVAFTLVTSPGRDVRSRRQTHRSGTAASLPSAARTTSGSVVRQNGGMDARR